MSRVTRKLEGASVVLHGAFEPTTFHPAWFEAGGLLAADEAKAALGDDVLVVGSELTAWRTGWLALQVTRQRLTASCDDVAHAAALGTLVEGVLGALAEPRLTALDLQRSSHVQLASDRDRQELFAALAPATPWGMLMAAPTVLELRLAGHRPHGGPPITIAVRPSSRVTPDGVQVEIDERHEAGDGAAALAVLATRWLDSLRESYAAVQALFEGVFATGA